MGSGVRTPATVAEELRLQGGFCAHTGSPFYGALLEKMAVGMNRHAR